MKRSLARSVADCITSSFVDAGVEPRGFVGLFAVERAERLLEVLRRGLVGTEHGSIVVLLGVPPDQQRHVRLLARGEDLDQRFRQEVAVDGRVEPRDVGLGGGFKQLLGRHRAERRKGIRAHSRRELDARPLSLGERYRRQRRLHQRAALADGAGDQISRQRRCHQRADRRRAGRFAGDGHPASDRRRTPRCSAAPTAARRLDRAAPNCRTRVAGTPSSARGAQRSRTRRAGS